MTQRVQREGRDWVGTCDHGDSIWTIHRGTEHNAWRSLRAHAKSCTASPAAAEGDNE